MKIKYDPFSRDELSPQVSIRIYAFLKDILRVVEKTPEIIKFYEYDENFWTLFKRNSVEEKRAHFDGVLYYWGVLDGYVQEYPIYGCMPNRCYGSKIEIGESCRSLNDGCELVPEAIVEYCHLQSFADEDNKEKTKEDKLSLKVFFFENHAENLYKKYKNNSRKSAEEDFYPLSEEEKENKKNREPIFRKNDEAGRFMEKQKNYFSQNYFYKERFHEEFPFLHYPLDIDLHKVNNIKVEKGDMSLFAQKSHFGGVTDEHGNSELWKRFSLVSKRKIISLTENQFGKQRVKDIDLIVQDSCLVENDIVSQEITIYRMPKGIFGRYLRSKKDTLAKKKSEE